jgi:hypothetical protein
MTGHEAGLFGAGQLATGIQDTSYQHLVAFDEERNADPPLKAHDPYTWSNVISNGPSHWVLREA